MTPVTADAQAVRIQPVYLLLIAGAILILSGLAWRGVEGRSGSRGSLGDRGLGLPARLLGVAATEPEYGADALETIQSMHGKGFPMVTAAVAHYGTATAWVAEAKDQAGARAMTADMTSKIAGGRSPFTPTGTRPMSGRTVYTLNGMGQSHFYWQAGTQVVWLAIDLSQAPAGLQEMIQAIN